MKYAHSWPGLALLLAACNDDAPTLRACDRLGLLCSSHDDPLDLGLTRSHSRVADLEGDGKPDLVTAGIDGSLSIAWGHDDQRDYLLVPGGVPDLRLGDLNGDHFPDLVYLTAEPSALRTRINLGARQFSDGPGINLAGQARSLWLGNLDADASLDAVVASAGEGTITVITDGLTRATPIAVGRDLVAIDVGDLDHDGRLDLIAADHGDAALYIALAAGSGFAAPRRVATGVRPQHLQLYDLDGDDHLDILTHGSSTPEIWFHRNDGDGGLASARALVVQSEPSQGFAAHRDAQGRRWLLTVSDERLIASELDDADQAVRRVVGNGFYPADGLDIDADTVLVHGAARTTRHSLAPAWVLTETWRDPTAPWNFTWADLDADGVPELLTVETDAVSIHARQADATWAERTRIEVPGEAYEFGPTTVAAAELTGDAHPDLVIGEFPAGVRVAIGDGDGGFTLGELTPLELTPDLLRAAPITGQPGSVIVAENHSPVSVGLLALRLDATGRVVTQTPLSTTAVAVSPLTADLDDDGDHDLLTILREDDARTLAIFTATATGWDPPRTRSLSALPGSLTSVALTLADLDDDADLDGLLTTTGTIVRLPDLAADPPPPPQLVDVPDVSEPDSAALADLDADGRLDLAVCRHGGPTLVLATPDGWLPQPPVAGTPATCALYVDPATQATTAAIVTDRGVSILTPSLAPGLDEQDRFNGSPAPLTALATGDIDADGHPDIVVAAAAKRSDSFTVLWGAADGHPSRATWQAISSYSSLGLAVAPLDDRPGDEIVVATDRGYVDIWTHQSGALELQASARPEKTSASVVGVQRHPGGLADIILYGGGASLIWHVTALPRDASGAFVDPQLGVPLFMGSSLQGIKAMTIADFDRDGHDDIVVPTQPVTVLWGAAEGVTPTVALGPNEHIFDSDTFAFDVAHADLDGASAPSLIVTTVASISRIDFTGRTPGPPRVLITTNINPQITPAPLHLADLESDGHADLLRIFDGTLTLTLRAPDRADARAVLTLGDSWSHLRAADLDSDGILDLIGLQNGNLVTRLSAPTTTEVP